jgi:hypothetical protein
MAASGVLWWNLSQGIHAAQPLTTLRASLGHTDRMSTDELRELAANSPREVERLCTFFTYLSVITSCCMYRAPLSIGESRLPCTRGLTASATYASRGGICATDRWSLMPCQTVLIESARTRQALSSVLLIAHGVSSAKDTVELIASSCSNAVQVVVRNLNSYVDAMNAEASFAMALARRTCSLEPFSVRIELQEALFVH